MTTTLKFQVSKMAGNFFQFVITETTYENGQTNSVEYVARGWSEGRSQATAKAKAKIKELLNLKNN